MNAMCAAHPSSSKDELDAALGDDAEKSSSPSQRPYETLMALAAVLDSSKPITIDTKFSKKHYDKMVTDALSYNGAVLIVWQHEDIPAIGQSILTQTHTARIGYIPSKWSAAAMT